MIAAVIRWKLMRVLLVHNPRAGDEEHNREALLRLIERGGHVVHYHEARTESWQDGLAAGVPAELVAVAGGDGTVGKVARALAGSGVPMAVLPLGTANNVSTVLGFAGIPLEELVAGWALGTPRPLDMGVARGPWGAFRFLESFGVGALAESMREVARGSAGHVDRLDAAHARIAAAMELIERTLRQTPARRLELSIDGAALSGDYILMEVANLGMVGPNLHVAPHADPSDGLLDVVLAGEDVRRTIADHLPRLRGAAGGPVMDARRGAHVQVRCHGLTAHMDDELWDARGSDAQAVVVDLAVERHGVTFLVPAR